MIPLFHIPSYTIDTSQFSNLLHDKIVRKFEEDFCQYVDAKYGCSLHSATAAIELIFESVLDETELAGIIKIPSIIPPVVPNAVMHGISSSGCGIEFTDNVNWVGHAYTLHETENFRIIDSAQEVSKSQFHVSAADDDIMIFSFYPTKPIGSADGCMVVSNNQAKIELLRELSMNGTSFDTSSWKRKSVRIGRKLYMNSLSAFIASENLKKLDEKKDKLWLLRQRYNRNLSMNNSSSHLFTIPVKDNTDFVERAEKAGIQCGIHYRPAHRNPIYGFGDEELPAADFAGRTTVSIPFHEMLTKDEIDKVIKFVRHEWACNGKPSFKQG